MGWLGLVLGLVGGAVGDGIGPGHLLEARMVDGIGNE